MVTREGQMRPALLGFAAAVALAAASATAQPSSEAIHIQTFGPGQAGPYFCPTGRLVSAKILPPAPDGIAIIKGKNGPNGLLTMGVGGPTCVALAEGEPEASAACFRLSKGSPAEVRVEVDCGN